MQFWGTSVNVSVGTYMIGFLTFISNEWTKLSLQRFLTNFTEKTFIKSFLCLVEQFVDQQRLSEIESSLTWVDFSFQWT